MGLLLFCGKGDKLSFMVASAGDIVGAIIDRPAVQCCSFAGNFSEFVQPAARALSERPYIHAITLRR